jgi:predicted adenine nucleotide alpha hydrolase (AANH) superfamily ATPase
MRVQGWSVHGFFYNPHIQPYQEFSRRLDTLKSFSSGEKLHLIVREDYDTETFFRQVAFRERNRCLYCYALRLEATARLAKKSDFDAFSTTLLYSRQQNHDMVRSIGEAASKKFGIAFYYEDFRAGWRTGQERAKALGLYRQQYCGCIYSEEERFRKPYKPSVL